MEERAVRGRTLGRQGLENNASSGSEGRGAGATVVKAHICMCGKKPQSETNERDAEKVDGSGVTATSL